MRIERNNGHHGGLIVTAMGWKMFIMPMRFMIIPEYGRGWAQWLGVWLHWRRYASMAD